MNDGERAEINKLTDSLNRVLLSKPVDSILQPDAEISSELADLFAAANALIENLAEMNRFAARLCKGDMEMDPPGRRNFLSAYLKELHMQLSGLSWSMEQLAAGHVVSKLAYKGKLFASFNGIVDKISSLSFGADWDWSANSWRYHQLMSAMNDLRIMIIEVSEDGEIIYANKAAKNHLARYDKSLYDDGCEDVIIQHFSECMECAEEFPIFREVHDNKHSFWYKITSDRVSLVDGRPGILHMIDDISEWKKHESTLKKTATYDALTGVYNRKAGMQSFDEIVLSDSEFCVAFVDIDGLKMINDSFGHGAGDIAIKTVAEVLSSLVRGDDIVIRYGGDEFIIVFRNCSRDEAVKVIGRMQKKLNNINCQGELPYILAFSHGVLEIPSGKTMSRDEIIDRIDGIMYEDKKQKKARLLQEK